MGKRDSLLYLDNLDSPILSPTINSSSTERFKDDIPPSALAERIFNDPGAWEISPYFETGNTDDDLSIMHFEQEMDWLEMETRKAMLETHSPQDTVNHSDVVPWAPKPRTVALSSEAQIRDPTQEEEYARGMRPISLSGIFNFNSSDLREHMEDEKVRERSILETVMSPPMSSYSSSSSSNSDSSTSTQASHLYSHQPPTLPLRVVDPITSLMTPCILSSSLTSPFNVYSASATLSFLEWNGIYPESPMVSQIGKVLGFGLQLDDHDQVTSISGVPRTPVPGNALGLSSLSQEISDTSVAPKSLEKENPEINLNGAQTTANAPEPINEGKGLPSTPTPSTSASAFEVPSPPKCDNSTLPQTPPRSHVNQVDLFNTCNSVSASTTSISSPSNSNSNHTTRRLPSLPMNISTTPTLNTGRSLKLKPRTPYTGSTNTTGTSEDMVIYTPPYTSITRPMPTPEHHRPSPPSSTPTHHCSNCNSDTPGRFSSTSYIAKENRCGNGLNENGANLERTSSTPNRSLKSQYRVRARTRPRRNFSGGTEGFISARECTSSYVYGHKRDILSSKSTSGFKELSPVPVGPRERKGSAGLGTPTRSSSGVVNKDYWAGIGAVTVNGGGSGSAEVDGTSKNKDEKETEIGKGVLGANESYVRQWVAANAYSTRFPLR